MFHKLKSQILGLDQPISQRDLISTKVAINNKLSITEYFNEVYTDLNNKVNTEKENLTLVKRKLLKNKLSEITEIEDRLAKLKNFMDKLNSLPKNEELNIVFSNVRQKIILENEISTINKYKILHTLNKSKFEDNFINKLKYLIKTIYNKDIELNIISLKNIYLDMGIFTETIASKLTKRVNTTLRVLGRALSIVKVDKNNRAKTKYGISFTNQTLINKVKNLELRSFITKKDSLNRTLFTVMFNPIVKSTKSFNVNLDPMDPIEEIKQLEELEEREEGTNEKIQNFVFKSLKYKGVGGVRIEAKGRLSKRFTASRKLFKFK